MSDKYPGFREQVEVKFVPISTNYQNRPLPFSLVDSEAGKRCAGSLRPHVWEKVPREVLSELKRIQRISRKGVRVPDGESLEARMEQGVDPYKEYQEVNYDFHIEVRGE